MIVEGTVFQYKLFISCIQKNNNSETEGTAVLLLEVKGSSSLTVGTRLATEQALDSSRNELEPHLKALYPLLFSIG